MYAAMDFCAPYLIKILIRKAWPVISLLLGALLPECARQGSSSLMRKEMWLPRLLRQETVRYGVSRPILPFLPRPPLQARSFCALRSSLAAALKMSRIESRWWVIKILTMRKCPDCAQFMESASMAEQAAWI